MRAAGESTRSIRPRWPGPALVASLALCPACPSDPPRTPPQHVILLVVDTLRADRLSCYGYSRPTTPTLDALAAEGIRFSHAVAQSSWTSPSMVSMLTSRYVAEETLAIPADRPTLAEAFKKAGFRTAAFITNDLLRPEHHFDRGFDEFSWQLLPYEDNSPILAWFDAQKDAKTFTFLHLAEPHDDAGDDHSYRPPPRFRRWQDAPDNVPSELASWHDQIEKELKLERGAESRAFIAAQRGAHDDDIACLDARVREIFDALKQNGQWQKTAVVLAADHGEGLWEYVQFPIGTRAKVREQGQPETLANTLHQTHGSHVALQLVHVPLILMAPGVAPAVVESWVENVDVLPTLLEIAGLPALADAHGQGLLALAADPEDHARAAVFTHTRYNSSLISQDGIQMIRPTPRGECEFATDVVFYDTGRDPYSRTNLVAKHHGRIGELEKLASERLKSGIVATQKAYSAETIRKLAGMGYLDSGVVDVVREGLRQLSIEDLIRKIREETDCLLRLEAVRALGERDHELEPAQKTALKAISTRDGSRAVREALAALVDSGG